MNHKAIVRLHAGESDITILVENYVYANSITYMVTQCESNNSFIGW